jgi:hypothetical protein
VGGHGNDADHDPAVTDRDHGSSLEQVWHTVTRFVKSRGLNYPVLLDADNRVGAIFGGGELPTHVVIDREGFIRRRFIGPRSLAVFEAMVNEARQPLPDPRPSGDGTTPANGRKDP